MSLIHSPSDVLFDQWRDLASMDSDARALTPRLKRKVKAAEALLDLETRGFKTTCRVL
jgi:hypothetical protein